MTQGQPEDDPRHSSFRLEVTVSAGYERRRTTLGGVWEGRLVTLGLLLGGIALVLLVVARVFQISL